MSHYIEIGRWSFMFCETWSDWVTRTRWKEFHLIEFAFEWDIYMGCLKLDLALLNLSCRVCYVYNQESEGRKVCQELIDERLAGEQ